ncbi:heterodisulfide reductase-related iron-sulfur binding cluster, partial [Streptomyces sp. NPDC058662]|uniref:(Fe-S)-binding protein n=1 Tax=Streptomyces sp. NPDC058662 TaxID=3346583 RepID=UPI00365813BE
PPPPPGPAGPGISASPAFEARVRAEPATPPQGSLPPAPTALPEPPQGAVPPSLPTSPGPAGPGISASPAFEARVRAEPATPPQGSAPPAPTAPPEPPQGSAPSEPRPQGPASAPPVTLWPDTFTAYLSPETGRAAVRVLEAAGLTVTVPAGRVCCGLTYVSTGRLDRARAVLRRTLDALHAAGAPHAEDGATPPVLVLEPSCAAALRTDLPALLPDDPRAHRLAAAVRTFAETLEEYAPAWRPPRLDRAVVGQTHCHQHAVLGDAADRRLRERAGLVGELSGGCCGLAGNFGFEPGHHEVSLACAEEQLLPSLRAAPADAVVQADGFSCRTQIAQLGPARARSARHLAELLADGLPEPPRTPPALHP